jgi:multidrug resistance efflux pump
MDLLIILTYGAICFAAFRFLKIPVNGYSVVTAILGGVVILGAILLGMNYNQPYSTLARTYFITTPIVPAVRGRVIEVPVSANTPLKQGDVLFRIDPAPYRHKVAQLEASLAQVESQVKSDENQLEIAKANLAKAAADQKLAKDQYDREAELVRKKVSAPVRLEQRQTLLDSANSAVDAARAAVGQAQDVLGASVADGTNAKIAQIQAQLEDAQWNLDQTTVIAPTDGYVTQVALHEGFYAVPLPLRPAMVFISEQPHQLVASFRQISTNRLEPGMEVEVAFYAEPGAVYGGKIKSVLPAMAAGELQASGTLVTPEQRQSPGRVTVVVDLDKAVDKLDLPAGSAGVAAVYTEHAEFLAIVRRILLRMTSWTFYLSFEH